MSNIITRVFETIQLVSNSFSCDNSFGFSQYASVVFSLCTRYNFNTNINQLKRQSLKEIQFSRDEHICSFGLATFESISRIKMKVSVNTTNFSFHIANIRFVKLWYRKIRYQSFKYCGYFYCDNLLYKITSVYTYECKILNI